jgi:diguanylate cyclase (GGDEF)-like protein
MAGHHRGQVAGHHADEVGARNDRPHAQEAVHPQHHAGLHARAVQHPFDGRGVLDIDRFKQINDQFGHDTGDSLLRAFADRLSQTLRSTDTVARLGGDEFTVIMEGLPRTEVAAHIADKIVQVMGAPFGFAQREFSVTVSIGLAFYQGDTTTIEALVEQADMLLYQAKRAGRNDVQTGVPAR